MWEEGVRIYGTPGVPNNFPNLVLLAFLKFKESREVDKSNISLTITLLVNYDLRNQYRLCQKKKKVSISFTSKKKKRNQYRLTYVVNDSNL